MGKCRATFSEKPSSMHIAEEEGELFPGVRGTMGRYRTKEFGETDGSAQGHAHGVTRAFAPCEPVRSRRWPTRVLMSRSEAIVYD